MAALSRREFLRMGSLAAAGVALAACAPKPTPTPAPEAPAEATEAPAPTSAPPAAEGTLIRYWCCWGGELLMKAWQDIQASEEFKEALGNNTFEVRDAICDEPVLTAVAGGDPPEGASNIEYLDFMARGVLLPIDDLVAASTVIKKEDYLEGVWDMCAYKGVTYGVPGIEGFLPFGLNYNARLVEEAGLDPEKPPKTWDEAYEWHVKLTQFDAAGNALRIGLNPYAAMGEGLWYAGGWMVATSWGWDWFDEETGTFDLNNEKLVEAFATQKRFIDYVGVDNVTALYSVEGRDTWGGAYNAEVEAMIIEGYWHPGETANSAPEVAKYNRATWLPVPEDRRNVNAQGTYTHMVIFFKDAKNPEGMFRIAEVLQKKVACDAFWKHLGWLPPLKSYIESIDPTTYPGLDFYFRCVKEATEWHSPAVCEITRFVANEYLTLKDQVNRGEITPEQAAEEMQNRCTAEYEAAGFKS